ncbi:MAG: CPBP family intramembrane glutamic endopeptidase [Chloroflexota bacterium]
MADARIDQPALTVLSSLAWKTALWIGLPWLWLARGGSDTREVRRVVGLDRFDRRAGWWTLATLAGGAAWWAVAAAVTGRGPTLEPLALVSLWWGAAVCEEVLCRGFLLGALRRGGTGPVAAIAISTVVFVLAHLPGWVAISHLSVEEIATRSVTVGVIGVVAALLRLGSGSLVPSILFHGIADMIAT